MNSNTSFGEFDSNLEDWESYSERLTCYLAANNVKDSKLVQTFLAVVGRKTYALLKNLTSPELPMTKSYEELNKILADHLSPVPIVIAERYTFMRRFQSQDESIADFVVDLKRLTQYCKFGQNLDERLRDQFVCGLRDIKIKDNLLTQVDLTFAKAIRISSAMEKSHKVSVQMNNEISFSSESASISKMVPRNLKNSEKCKCSRCGEDTHNSLECRFKTAICHRCKNRGHLRKMCKFDQRKLSKNYANSAPGTSSFKNASKSRDKREASLQTCDVDKDDCGAESDASISFDVIKIENCKAVIEKPIFVSISIEGKSLAMELDTGAAVTVLPESIFVEFFSHLPLFKSSLKVQTYSGENLTLLGSAKVQVLFQGKRFHDLILFIVKEGKTPLLGRSWIKALGILNNCKISVVQQLSSSITKVQLDIKLQEMLKTHEKLFENKLGLIKNYSAILQIKENAIPKFFKARPVPFALKPAVDAELDKLISQGIISPVEFSKWASPVVPIVKKDKSIRLCGDYKVGVNPVLNVDQYPLPRIDEMFTHLNGGKLFSKIDLAQAYLQMEVHPDSREFLTINTHRGLFAVNRLAFGIASAPAIFQRTMEQIISGIPGVICYLDDILVTGNSNEDHLLNLNALLHRLRKAGLRLNKRKCSFLQEKVEYLGHVLDAKGLHPSPDKISAVLNAPIPKDVTQLRSFLGLVSYYRKFLPNLATILHPLNDLLCKGRKWNWNPDSNAAFKTVKKMITSSSVLVHFDSSLPIVLACDASAYGLGAVISHVYPDGSEKPIAFSSRTLTKPEQSYAQIDREALSIVFGVKKFHQFLYGRKFKLLTDHQPLVRIFGSKSEIPTLAAARLQRWALILATYMYDIVYRNTKAHGNADALSRLPVPYNQSSCVDEEETPVDLFLINSLENSPVTSQEVAKETLDDPMLKEVLRYTQRGWPSDSVQKSLVDFYRRKQEITLLHGCLMWGLRVIIPKTLQPKILAELHNMHTGTVKMKLLARSYFWWPGIDEEINHVTSSCDQCLQQRNAPSKATLHPWAWPTKPWQRIHVDFAGPFKNRNFLVIIDAHSKWPEVFTMRSTTTSNTIQLLKSVMARFGFPHQLVSDNGPQFTSKEFAIFCKNHGIKHTRSAPFHPASNGQAERFVQVLKKNLSKEVSGLTIDDQLLRLLFTYRSTPHCTTRQTPAALFLQREIRTRFDLLIPSIEDNVHSSQSKQVLDCAGFSNSVTFDLGENVMARNYSGRQKWVPAVVESQTGPVSFCVRLDSGVRWKRHQDQLIKVCPSDRQLTTPESSNISVTEE